MANPELRILIRAIDRASATLTRVGGSASSMGDELAGAARKARPLGRALLGAGAAGTALMGASVLTAAKVETLGIVLNTVGENAGYSKDEIAAFDAGVQSMGITTRASRQSLLHMAQANLDLGRATDLARLAQDAAVIANINSSVAYEKLVRGIQQGRTIILRTMGLNVDFQASYARMAKQLGVTTVELTRSQKMTARLNEVLEVGARISGTYEDAMGSVGKQLSSLPRFYEEAGLALGTAYLPQLETLVEVQTELLKAFVKMHPEQQTAISLALALGSGVAVVSGGLILIIPKIAATATALKGLAVAAAAANLSLGPIGWAAIGITAVTVATGAAIIATRDYRLELIELAEKQRAFYSESAQEGIMSAGIWADVAEAQLEGITRITDGWYSMYSPALQNAREMTDGWATSLGSAIGKTIELEEVIYDLAPVVKGLAGDFSFSAEQAFNLAIQMGLADQAAIDLAVEMGFLTQKEADLRIAQVGLTQDMIDGRIQSDEYRAGLRELATKAIVLDRDTRIAAGGVEILRSGMQQGAGAARSLASKASEAASALGRIPRKIDVDINWYHRIHGSRPDTSPDGPQEYASGTDYVPYTGVFKLHKGEAVIPANKNKSYSRSSSSSVVVHNHFGANSVRSEQDILDLASEIEHTLALRGLQRAL